MVSIAVADSLESIGVELPARSASFAHPAQQAQPPLLNEDQIEPSACSPYTTELIVFEDRLLVHRTADLAVNRLGEAVGEDRPLAVILLDPVAAWAL